jgi:hypothetical protein
LNPQWQADMLKIEASPGAQVEEFSSFRVGQYVRINFEYTERTLRGQMGRIVGIPDQEESCEYLLVIEEGYFVDPTLCGRKVLMHCRYFDRA